MDFGRIAYAAYCESVGGVSKFTGEKLPAYADQDDEIQAAWETAASAVRQDTIRAGVEAGDPSALALLQADTLRAQLHAIEREAARAESGKGVDEQYLTTLREQEHSAKLQSSVALAQSDLIAAGRVLIDEQHELAKLQREHLVGVTWRLAVACAAEGAGSPTEGDGVHERIQADAEWFEHLLGTPPVDF